MRVDGGITRRLIVGCAHKLTIGPLYTIRDSRNYNLSVPALCCAVLCCAVPYAKSRGLAEAFFGAPCDG